MRIATCCCQRWATCCRTPSSSRARAAKSPLTSYAVADRILIDCRSNCGGLPQGDAEAMFRPFVQGSDDKRGLGWTVDLASQRGSQRRHLSVRDVSWLRLCVHHRSPPHDCPTPVECTGARVPGRSGLTRACPSFPNANRSKTLPPARCERRTLSRHRRLGPRRHRRHRALGAPGIQSGGRGAFSAGGATSDGLSVAEVIIPPKCARSIARDSSVT